MIRSIKMRYFQFLEQSHKSGLASALKFCVYRCEEAVPVEKDLTALKPLPPPPDGETLELREFTDQIPAAGIDYPLKSRGEKAVINLARGYRYFVLVRDGVAIADLWYVTKESATADGIRKYLRWFGIELGEKEAYMFDLQVSPDARGKAHATYFLASVLHRMQEKGFSRVYGYFDAHNIPALWVHRLLGYKERPRLLVKKLFVYERATLDVHGAPH
jgi:GNAT superfamily N-acetyltransferase